MIIAHVLVHQHSAYLDMVLERASAWADLIFCAAIPNGEMDAIETWADAWIIGDQSWVVSEPLWYQRAWDSMASSFTPEPEDKIMMITGDELVIEPDMLLKDWGDQALSFNVHYIWDKGHYRTDGWFTPKPEPRMFPFRANSHFYGPDFLAPMWPSHIQDLPTPGRSISDIANLRFTARSPQRRSWEHLNEVIGLPSSPQLLPWTKGGLNNVG